MPKKVHGRPAKAKSRPRRPSTPRQMPSGAPEVGGDGTIVAERVSTGVPVPAAVAAAAASPVTGRRSAAGGRRAPVTAINYRYLRHDITALAILAPAMIVILVIAFIVLH